MPPNKRRKNGMKLKTLLPLILLTLLLTRTGYGQTSPELPETQKNDYGIEPEKSYPGWMLLEILEAAESEIDTAVTEAYEQGYKAAALQYAPRLAGQTALYEMTLAELEAERKKSKITTVFAVPAFRRNWLSGRIFHAFHDCQINKAPGTAIPGRSLR
jgi:hypothetical protein